MPDSIDDHPARQWIVGAKEIFSEFTAAAFLRLVCRAIDCFEKAAWDAVERALVVAPIKEGLISSLPLGNRRDSGGIRDFVFELAVLLQKWLTGLELRHLIGKQIQLEAGIEEFRLIVCRFV